MSAPSRAGDSYPAGAARTESGRRPLTVVLVHNRYLERGGEDVVYEAEAELLERRGHTVHRFEADNREVAELGRVRLAARTVWNRESYRALRALVERAGADVVHIHNTLPLLSPAVHHAGADGGAAVVQTLHNFRLMCPQGMLLRDGRPCEDCVGRTPPWPGVLHGCYRGSRPATAAVAAMLTAHRGLGTWHRRVDAFIALSEFARTRFVRGGLPAERLHVKPNFLDPDPGAGTHEGDFLLYVGRLSAEKGIETLLEGWRRVVGGAMAGAADPGGGGSGDVSAETRAHAARGGDGGDAEPTEHGDVSAETRGQGDPSRHGIGSAETRGQGDPSEHGTVSAETPVHAAAEQTPRERGRPPTPPRLLIVGDGPLAPAVAEAARSLPGLTWEGRQPRARVLELMGRARALVFPSLCYENFPGVIAEAYARGLPVIGSRLGSTAEVVREGETGALFEAGDAADLASALRWALRPEAGLAELGRNARAAYEGSYTAERSYERLLEVYRAALERRGQRAAASGSAGAAAPAPIPSTSE